MMPKLWKLEFSEEADKQISKMDKGVFRQIMKHMESRILNSPDPRAFGKPLQGNLAHYWRYRVKDYRIICDIQDETITILVLAVGHRKEIYA